MKRYFALFLVVTLLITTLSGCFGSSNTNTIELTYNLPNVANEMYSANYWLESVKNSDKVLLTDTEIAQINAQISSVAKNYTTDLISYPSSLTVSQITSMLDTMKIEETKLYTSDGTAFAEGYLDSLSLSINAENLPSTTKVSYGLLLNNDFLRTMPTSTEAFVDPTDLSVDLFQRGIVNIGEPVVVIYGSAEQTWFFVKTANNYGWVNAESIVFMEKGSWVDYIESNEFLVVTAPELTLDVNPYSVETSGLTLRMGTRLPLYGINELGHTSLDGQGIAGGYLAKIPIKNSLGYLEFVPMYVPISDDISIGYLPYTTENLVNQAFKLLGRRYCENGIYDGRDNESFICDIYKTFGFNFPATTKLQSEIVAEDIDVSDLMTDDTIKKMKKLPVGTLLFTDSEAMIYVGSEDGLYYVIHPARTFYFDEKRYDANATVITTLDIVKKDGSQYIDALETLKTIKIVKD